MSVNADLLKKDLFKFYSNKTNLKKFLSIKNKDTKYSGSQIEWFCNNYSKTHGTSFDLNGKIFNVYLSYKSQLDSYNKKLFDPFNRYYKPYKVFFFEYDPKKPPIKTTLCQLNFFRWCIKNKILEYVEANLKEIKDSMPKKGERIKKQIKLEPQCKKLKKPVNKTCVRYFSKQTIKL